MRNVLLAMLLAVGCLLGLSADVTYAQPEEENQDGGPGDCIASWDPFCPQGTPWEEGGTGGGSDFPSPCYYCEMTSTGGKCSQVPEGSTGKTDCTNIYEGTDPVYCQTSGNTFCENITVTP